MVSANPLPKRHMIFERSLMTEIVRLLVWHKHNMEFLNNDTIKGELGELQFYFRKIPLHQQIIFVVSVLSNSPWFLRNLKNRSK